MAQGSRLSDPRVNVTENGRAERPNTYRSVAWSFLKAVAKRCFASSYGLPTMIRRGIFDGGGGMSVIESASRYFCLARKDSKAMRPASEAASGDG
jgi:hypothetical protein